MTRVSFHIINIYYKIARLKRAKRELHRFAKIYTCLYGERDTNFVPTTMQKPVNFRYLFGFTIGNFTNLIIVFFPASQRIFIQNFDKLGEVR